MFRRYSSHSSVWHEQMLCGLVDWFLLFPSFHHWLYVCPTLLGYEKGFADSWQPVFTIDRIGRKPFFIVGSAAQAICFFVVAGVFANLPPESSPQARTYGIVIVSFIYIYFAFFSSCWLGSSWVYSPEILPLKGRTLGMGLATGRHYHLCWGIEKVLTIFTVCLWMFNFLIGMISLLMTSPPMTSPPMTSPPMTSPPSILVKMLILVDSRDHASSSSEHLVEILCHSRRFQRPLCSNYQLLLHWN